MKIELLEKRENFYEIFLRNMQSYINNEYARNIQICWKKGKRFSNGNFFYVNSKLNIIFPAKVDYKIIRNHSLEYIYNRYLFRTILHYLYVMLATNKFTYRFFIKGSFHLSNWIDDLDNIFFIPGNNKIRLFEKNSSFMKVFLKSGFDEKFLMNEILIRKKYPFLPTTKIFSYNQKNNYYSEELIKAIPINRIRNSKRKVEAFNFAQKSLKNLYEKSSETKRVEDYFKSLKKRFNENLGNISSIYSAEDKKYIIDAFLKISENLNFDFQEEIILAQTHGDFQMANILINIKNKVYLIDWEYTDIRSIFYDVLVFEFNMRGKFNLDLSCKKILINKKIQLMQYCLPSHIKLTRNKILIFLLEEFSFKLNELCNPELLSKSKTMENWLAQVENLRFESLYK